MRKTPHVVSFRLDPTHFAQLAEQAGSKASVGAFARELVLRALHQEQWSATIDERLRLVVDHQIQLRRDIRLTLQAIIAGAAKLPAEEAQEYVKRILR